MNDIKTTDDNKMTDNKNDESTTPVEPHKQIKPDNTSKKRKCSLSKLDILGIVLLCIFVPIIIINFALAAKGAVNEDKVPMIFNRAPLIIISDSMTIGYHTTDENYNGAFNKNDLIIIKKVDSTNLEIGTIATYIAEDGSVITHRIIAKKTDEDGNVLYTMKGDNSPSSDVNPVSPEQIQGVFVSRIPKLGGLAMKMSEPIGVFVLMLIPIAILGTMYFIKNRKKTA